MFKILSNKVNIIKTTDTYQTSGIVGLFEPLMSDRYNYVSNSEYKLKRLINNVSNGDVIIFNSREGISLINKSKINIITVNLKFNGKITIQRKNYTQNEVKNFINNKVRLMKVKNLMKCQNY